MRHPTTRRATKRDSIRRVLGACAIVLSVALLVGCGGGEPAGETVVDAGGPAEARTPTLPPIEEREPELFDPQGCLENPSGGSDCSTTAEDVDANQAGDDESSWRSLEGFVGSRWTSELRAGALVVLGDSITVTETGPWSARGLVRNESPDAVADVRVEATLLDASGRALEVVSGRVPVSPVRPGEPAPFMLSAGVDATVVADVRWALAGAGGVPVEGRSLELSTWWQRGFGDPRPLDTYLYRDEGGAHPHVAAGSVEALDAAVSDLSVVGAWVDESGRVLWVEQATVVRPDRDADLDGQEGPVLDDPDAPAPSGEVDGVRTSPDLEPGAMADFVLVAGEGAAPATIDEAALYLWGGGS